MQDVMNETFPPVTTETMEDARKRAPAQGITLSVEWIAYAILLLIALMMRFAELDTVPMAAGEAREALAAWRAVGANTSGSALLPSSPLLFLVQSLGFTTLGLGESVARMATALVGVGLVFSPLLFRAWLGRERAFLTSLILLCSPVLLLASRESSPTIWAMGCAILILWAGGRYFNMDDAMNRTTAMGTALIVLIGVLVFLTERGGVLLLGIAAGGLLIGDLLVRRTQRFTFEDEETPGADALDKGLGAGFRALPWGTGLPIAALIVLATATGFLLYPVGLSGIGEIFSGLIAGFTSRAPGGTFAYPVAITLFYEPWTVGLAFIGAIALFRRGALGLADSFLLGAVVVALIMSTLFIGASPAHALWLSVPFAYLAASLLEALLGYDGRAAMWGVPSWGRWVMTLVTLGLLAAFTVALQAFARGLANLGDGDISTIAVEPAMMVLLIVSVLFLIVSFFMASSLWEARTAWRGLGIGVAIFGLITSLGAGWDASVVRADSPLELWHTQEVTHRDSALLRETLLDVAEREGAGFTGNPILVLAPDNRAAAWLVRDFNAARFAAQITPGEPTLLIANGLQPSEADLGGAYVGQDFTLHTSWDASLLTPAEFLTWWTQRIVRTEQYAINNADLWLRSDIYQGVQPQNPAE